MVRLLSHEALMNWRFLMQNNYLYEGPFSIVVSHK